MSDDAQPPAAPEHDASRGPAQQRDAVPGAPATDDARDPWAPETSVRETGSAAALDSNAIPVVQQDDPDPWAAPAGPGATVVTGGPAAPVPPSVHDQQTVTSLPTADGNPPPAPPWAAPTPSTGAPRSYPPSDPFAPPGPTTPAAAYAPAPQPQGAPPPPIAPDGPGRASYGHPAPYPPAGYGQPGLHAPGHHHPAWPGAQPMPNNGLGTAALVVGILSVVGFCLWPVALVTGVLAIVFGVIGRQRASRGEATNGGQALAGIVCGSVGAALGVGMLALLSLA